MKGRKKLKYSGIDSELAEYIESVRLKRSFAGIDEESMWMVILRIQKYYEEKNHEMEIRYEAQKELMNKELDALADKNAELRQKLIWLIDRIRTAGIAVGE